MDPFEKTLMFEHWVEDMRERQDTNKNLGYLIGSFTNPQAVQDLINRENNSHVADEEEFNELSKKIIEHNKDKDKRKVSRRKRKALAAR